MRLMSAALVCLLILCGASTASAQQKVVLLNDDITADGFAVLVEVDFTGSAPSLMATTLLAHDYDAGADRLNVYAADIAVYCEAGMQQYETFNNFYTFDAMRRPLTAAERQRYFPGGVRQRFRGIICDGATPMVLTSFSNIGAFAEAYLRRERANAPASYDAGDDTSGRDLVLALLGEDDAEFRASGGGSVAAEELGLLPDGMEESVVVALRPNTAYGVTGACDESCSDLDLWVQTTAGAELGSDSAMDDAPWVEFTTDGTGRVRIGAVMADCSADQCHYGFHVYPRP